MTFPPETLADRLAAARRARFVGRAAECARVGDALGADALPFHVVLIHGPGGIGKTSLLDEIARLGREAGAAVARIDGRDLDPVPDAVAGAAERALAEARGPSPRRLLLIDTYERIEAVDGWLRRTFVPGLRATDLVVIAGRHRPAPEWRSEWAGEVVVMPLRNLAPTEAAAYLADCGIPDDAHERVLAFTHGHPLALTLVAERVRQGDADATAFDPAAAPDLLADLLGRFVLSVPSPAHRAALEGAAVVRSVTVPLLAALLDAPGDAAALFEWLRELAFVETDAHGARLHDVVRETVEADLRWRDAPRHADLHARARRAVADRLRGAASEAARQRALGDYLHLLRDNPVVRPLVGRLREAWADADLAGSGPVLEGDADAIRQVVARHASGAEAEAVAGWLRARPEAAEVFRAADGTAVGFLLTLPLHDLDPDAREADPATAAVWDAVGSRLRPGERGVLFRAWADARTWQGVSAVQSRVFARTVEAYLTTPGLASSVLLTTEPELWTPVFELVGLSRWPDAEAHPAALGVPLAAFGKDWRASPPDAWLDRLAALAPTEAPPPPPARDDVVVLSADAFAQAVRDALKAYATPRELAESPLLRSRLVREQGGEPVEALRQLLADAAHVLSNAHRDHRYFRALDLTYLRPAPTQAIAAERLDLPFSTFRRHLGRGVDHVVATLWAVETGG